MRWHLPGNYLSYGAVLFRTGSTHEYINLRKGHLPRTLVIATSFFGKVNFFNSPCRCWIELMAPLLPLLLLLLLGPQGSSHTNSFAGSKLFHKQGKQGFHIFICQSTQVESREMWYKTFLGLGTPHSWRIESSPAENGPHPTVSWYGWHISLAVEMVGTMGNAFVLFASYTEGRAMATSVNVLISLDSTHRLCHICCILL